MTGANWKFNEFWMDYFKSWTIFHFQSYPVSAGSQVQQNSNFIWPIDRNYIPSKLKILTTTSSCAIISFDLEAFIESFLWTSTIQAMGVVTGVHVYSRSFSHQCWYGYIWNTEMKKDSLVITLNTHENVIKALHLYKL